MMVDTTQSIKSRSLSLSVAQLLGLSSRLATAVPWCGVAHSMATVSVPQLKRRDMPLVLTFYNEVVGGVSNTRKACCGRVVASSNVMFYFFLSSPESINN
uniref:Putative secreted protein n=1 Tax=Anopheles darlingi TaxID=43151 RepID=A0A2M4DBU9_ANODA